MRVYAVEYTYVYLSPNTDVRVHVMTYVAYLHDQQDPEHTGGGKGVPVTHPASLPVKTVCVDLLWSSVSALAWCLSGGVSAGMVSEWRRQR